VSKPYNNTYYTFPLPECVDVPATDLTPVVPWTVGANPSDTENLTVDIDSVLKHGFNRWEVGGEPMWLDWASPTIQNLANTSWNPEYDVILESAGEGTDGWGWVYFVIQGLYSIIPVTCKLHGIKTDAAARKVILMLLRFRTGGRSRALHIPSMYVPLPLADRF
jgi:hypothetical protein